MARKVLTPKQRRFCEEYVVDNNGKQAAIRAGYSAKSAEVHASRMLSNAKVQEYVAELKLQIAERNGVTVDRVVQELANIAFGTIGAFFRILSDGTPVLDMTGATAEQIATLSEISTEEYVVGKGEDAQPAIRVKIKQHSKLKALELLGQHLGMYKTKLDVNHSGGVEIDVFGLSDEELEKVALRKG